MRHWAESAANNTEFAVAEYTRFTLLLFLLLDVRTLLLFLLLDVVLYSSSSSSSTTLRVLLLFILILLDVRILLLFLLLLFLRVLNDSELPQELSRQPVCLYPPAPKQLPDPEMSE